MEKNKNKSMKKNSSIICYPNLVKKKQIDQIFMIILKLFKLYYPNLFKWLPKKIDSTIWKSKKFQDSIIKARKSSKKKFSKIYDTIQLSIPVRNMMASENLISVVEKYTKIKKENFVCIHSCIRFDPPFDNRNTVDWHTDDYPNITNSNPIHGVSVVVALHDTKIKHGVPIFLLDSHKKKINQKVILKKGARSGSHIISSKIINKFKKKIFELNTGDILIFPMRTIHKSGQNISNEVRISCLFRYYPINKEGFVALKESLLPIN